MNLPSTRVLILAVLGLAATPLWAQSADQSQVATAAAQGVQGRLAINQAAGVGNAQANLMVLAQGKHASASARVGQFADNPTTDRAASTGIEAGAFNGFQGALALNQAAGANNLQSNVLVIEARAAFATTDDATLAQTAANVATTEGAGSAPEVSREARIDANAFRGASGVLQVNQSAGVGNSAANAVVVRLPASAGGL